MNGFIAILQRALKACASNQDADGKRHFSPQHQTNEEAQEALLEVVHRAPRVYGQTATRWTLATLLRTCSWLKLSSEGGMCRLLQRLGIVYKRGRLSLHSPDMDYAAKLAYLQSCYQQALQEPQRYIFLYLDETSYYRQPTLERAYEKRGDFQASAPLSHHTNRRWRAIGALNALTGQVLYRQAEKITVAVQTAFYRQIHAAYPEAELIYVAQDNWPNHAHPKVVEPLMVQRSPFWPHTFANWSTAERYTQPTHPLPIQLIFLPTYAPWTNPIEKLWRWLKQQVIHLHPLSDDWAQLKQRVLVFMAQFAFASPDLLRYVGLLPI